MSSPRSEESPRFSILIPSYNRAGYLLEALEGVRAQSFTDYELIIIDDASPDDSAAVIERWLASTGVWARFIRHATNVGLVGVINEFAALARGELLTWCACDDVWLPGRLERHAAAFARASDDVAIVCGNCELIDAEGRSLGLLFDETFRFPEDPHAALLSLERIFIATPSCTLRKTCVDAVGRWNARYLQEDFDMFLRLTERYAVVFQDEVGEKYRQLADSFGKSRSNADRFAADTLRILLDRRPRTERERMAIESGKARLLELAYAYTHETGSPASNASLLALINAAGSGNTRHRLMALCVRANIPFAAYWTAAKLIRRIERISRAWRPSGATAAGSPPSARTTDRS